MKLGKRTHYITWVGFLFILLLTVTGVTADLGTYRWVPSRLLMSGTIYKNETNEVGYSVELDAVEEIGSGEILERDTRPGDVALQLLDSEGNILLSRNLSSSSVLSISYVGGGEVRELNYSRFAITLERPENTESIRFVGNGKVIYERHASEHTPEITLITPKGGQSFKEKVMVSWSASDADGDVLTYSGGISNDGGETYHTFFMDQTETTHLFDIRETLFEPSKGFLIRIRAADGFLSTEANTSAAFEIDSDCADIDNDHVCDISDNCINTPNEFQKDTDENDVGDACEGGVDTPVGHVEPERQGEETGEVEQPPPEGTASEEASEKNAWVWVLIFGVVFAVCSVGFTYLRSRRRRE